MRRRKGKARSIADSTQARCERRIQNMRQAVFSALCSLGNRAHSDAVAYIAGVDAALEAVRRKETSR